MKNKTRKLRLLGAMNRGYRKKKVREGIMREESGVEGKNLRAVWERGSNHLKPLGSSAEIK